MIQRLTKLDRERFDTVVLDFLTRYGVENKQIKNLVRTLSDQLWLVGGRLKQTTTTGSIKTKRATSPTTTSLTYNTPSIANSSTTNNTSAYQELVNNIQNSVSNIQASETIKDKQQISFFKKLLVTLDNLQENISEFKEKKKEKGLIGIGAEKVTTSYKQDRETTQREPTRLEKAANWYINTNNKLDELEDRFKQFQEEKRKYGLIGIAARNFYNRYQDKTNTSNISITQNDTNTKKSILSTREDNIANTNITNNELNKLVPKENETSQKQTLLTPTNTSVTPALDFKNIVSAEEKTAQKEDLLSNTESKLKTQTVLLEGIDAEALDQLTSSLDKSFKPLFKDLVNKFENTGQTIKDAIKEYSNDGNSSGGLIQRLVEMYAAKKGLDAFKRKKNNLTSKPTKGSGKFRTGAGKLLRGLPAGIGALSAGTALFSIGTEGREKYTQDQMEQFQGTGFWDRIKNIGKGLLDPVGLGAAGVGGLEQLYVTQKENELQEEQIKQQQKFLETQSAKKQAMVTAGFKNMEQFDAALYGYKNVDEFKKARAENKLDTSKMQDWKKFLPKVKEKGSPGLNFESKNKIQQLKTDTAETAKFQEIGNQASSLLQKENTEGLKNLKQELKALLKTEDRDEYNKKIETLQNSDMLKNSGIHLLKEQPDVKWNSETQKLEPVEEKASFNLNNPTTTSSFQPQATTVTDFKSVLEQTPLNLTPTENPYKIKPDESFSSTINNISNSNVDNNTLTSIAENTETTNNKLQILSQAILELAKTFANNSNKQPGNNLFINGSQQPIGTSASNTASNNDDAIRRVRQMFLAT